MKIKVCSLPYEEVINRKQTKTKKPLKPSIFWRTLIRLVSIPDLAKTNFTYKGSFKEEKGPYLILMNHSSFIDLEIAHRIMYPIPFGIVCTSDGFVGKNWLMRQIGCIPTRKFVTDVKLISDMKYLLKKKKTSVLMYPEASYSFDGCATPLPRKLGLLLKKLDVPVVFIRTYGAFTNNPLYNCLKRRKVDVSAEVKVLITKEQVKNLSVDELDTILDDAFTFDHFKWQKENHIKVSEDFRAEGLERILYRCPNCQSEGTLKGEGIKIKCHSCQKEYILDEYGTLCATNGETEFPHIPDWYNWERQTVKEEIEGGKYSLDVPVDISMMTDYKAIYNVGKGRLIHTSDGFKLEGCNGKLNYSQKVQHSYGLYADYYWYEIGDVICIGDADALYYCFPPEGVPVAKTRLAAEELYKLYRRNKKKKIKA